MILTVLTVLMSLGLGLGILFLFMGVINAFTAIRMRDARELSQVSEVDLPSVSILIPARDEAENLKRLLPLLMASRSKPLEILVLDDGSSDGTAKVAREILAQGKVYFRVIEGQTWRADASLSGKNSACAQLTEYASGEVFIFCDADMRVSPEAIGRTLRLLQMHACSGVTGLPRQISQGVKERLVLPWIMQLPIILSLPLAYGWKTRFSSLQMANGQWLAVRRESYFKIGGHAALGRTVLEDVTLARRLVEQGQPGILPVLASEDLSVEMYAGWEKLVDGFSKNLISLFGGDLFRFGILVMIINLVFTLPLWGLFISWRLALADAVILLICRMITARLFNDPLGNLTFHCRSLFLFDRLVFLVSRRHSRGDVSWKGRKIDI